MITIEQKGDFSKSTRYLNKLKKPFKRSVLEKYGQQGVQALRKATPVDTGKTAASWYYEIEQKSDQIAIYFNNSNINIYANIAILLDVGHGTKNGGWVQGRHYIDPAIQPIFDKISDDVWKEVVRNE